jgi:membrane-bound lytic murein transglycosylase B
MPVSTTVSTSRAALFVAAAVFAQSAAVRAAAAHPPSDAQGYAARADVRAFVDELALERGMSRRELMRVFAAARYQPKVVAAMQRPIVEPPKWFEYAPQFLTPERVDGGVAFFHAHRAELERAEREYGVPADIIVAIIGVETFYGRHLGSYRVIDSLATLAFDYPRRATFFRGELKEFLQMADEQRVSPLAPRGSFAGAMGVPQFMPGSYRRFAVDFDGDGQVDLWGSGADIVGSVAHYLARHDWVPGEPVLLPVTIEEDERETAMRRLDGGISERRTLAAWEADGVHADALPSALPGGPVGLLLLEDAPVAGREQATLWIACPNFFVITRYNRSRLYAAAVWHLAQAIGAARQ